MTQQERDKIVSYTTLGMGIILFLSTVAVVFIDQYYSTLKIYHFNLEWYQILGMISISVGLAVFNPAALRRILGKKIDKHLDE